MDSAKEDAVNILGSSLSVVKGTVTINGNRIGTLRICCSNRPIRDLPQLPAALVAVDPICYMVRRPGTRGFSKTSRLSPCNAAVAELVDALA